MKYYLMKLVVSVGVAIQAFGQSTQIGRIGADQAWSGYNNFATGSMRWAEKTVAGLGSAAAQSGKVFVVTDATTNSDCTVGGSSGFSAICRSNGSSWISIGGGSGSVSSVATGCGTSGGPITATGTVIATLTPKSDATAAYLFLNGDCGKRIIRSNAGAMGDTLPNASGFDTNWYLEVHNNGPGAETITATVSTFQGGAAAITLYAGQFARIVRNGADYSASGQFVLCPTCAGAVQLAEGTAAAIVANTVTRYAPTSVTGYTLRELAAACTGILLLTNTANDMVPTCLASTGTGAAVRANSPVIDSLTVTTSCTGCGSGALISGPYLSLSGTKYISPFMRPATIPPALTFKNTQGSSAQTVNADGSVTFASAPVASDNLVMLGTTIGANTTLTVALSPNTFHSTAVGVIRFGVAVRESSGGGAGKMISLEYFVNTGTALANLSSSINWWTNQTTYAGTSTGNVAAALQSSVYYFKLVKSGTDFLASISTDGISYSESKTVPGASHFTGTPDQWGVVLSPGQTSSTMYAQILSYLAN